MLDRVIQNSTQKPLRYLGRILLKKIHPNQMTFIGFVLGVLMCFFIFISNYEIAIIFLFLNRFCDGLDGAMARLETPTALGGYLDIISDLLIYGGFVLCFGLSNQENLTVSLILLFCYLGTSSTFLTKAAIQPAIKNTNTHEKDIPKSFHYASGIVEGTETIIYMLLCLILPEMFLPISIFFIFLCLLTIAFRIIVCYKELN